MSTICLKDYIHKRIEADDILRDLHFKLKVSIFNLRCFDLLFGDSLPFEVDEDEVRDLEGFLLDDVIQKFITDVPAYYDTACKMSSAFEELTDLLKKIAEETEAAEEEPLPKD